MCPKAKEPGVAKHAEAEYEAYHRRTAASRAKQGGDRCQKFVNFKDMNPSDQRKMHEQVLTSSAVSSQSSTSSSIATRSAGSANGTSGPTVFMISVPAQVLQSPARRTLLVQI